ncbi:MAG: hypothetical protein GIW98_07105 [Candidatus Eremiobacteraeota bacterium]|nr:hypothetical protein [Candidatus Eremiobacteraeota bacterium]
MPPPVFSVYEQYFLMGVAVIGKTRGRHKPIAFYPEAVVESLRVARARFFA